MREIRCPEGFNTLFGKVQVPSDTQVAKLSIAEGNLLEFSCNGCKRKARKRAVLHRYNLLGEWVETEEIT